MNVVFVLYSVIEMGLVNVVREFRMIRMNGDVVQIYRVNKEWNR